MGEIVAASNGPDPSWLACQYSLHKTSMVVSFNAVLWAQSHILIRCDPSSKWKSNGFVERNAKPRVVYLETIGLKLARLAKSKRTEIHHDLRKSPRHCQLLRVPC